MVLFFYLFLVGNLEDQVMLYIKDHSGNPWSTVFAIHGFLVVQVERSRHGTDYILYMNTKRKEI